jgi:hypothetical protein
MINILKLFGIYYLYKNHKAKLFTYISLCLTLLFVLFFTSDLVALLEKSDLKEYVIYPYVFKWVFIFSIVMFIIFKIKKSVITTNKNEEVFIKDCNTKTIDLELIKKNKLMSKADLIFKNKK